LLELCTICSCLPLPQCPWDHPNNTATTGWASQHAHGHPSPHQHAVHSTTLVALGHTAHWSAHAFSTSQCTPIPALLAALSQRADTQGALRHNAMHPLSHNRHTTATVTELAMVSFNPHRSQSALRAAGSTQRPARTPLAGTIGRGVRRRTDRSASCAPPACIISTRHPHMPRIPPAQPQERLRPTR
jgi:hypothetical protein